MAGLVLACIVVAVPDPGAPRWLPLTVAPLVFCVALLMISRLRYRSFREIDLRNRRPYGYVLPVAVGLVAIAVHPKGALFVLCTAYLLSAPTVYLWGLIRRRRRVVPAAGAAGAEVADEPALR
jgi:CDP-diacylglycerol--serine O-phosphatidyltransferase